MTSSRYSAFAKTWDFTFSLLHSMRKVNNFLLDCQHSKNCASVLNFSCLTASHHQNETMSRISPFKLLQYIKCPVTIRSAIVPVGGIANWFERFTYSTIVADVLKGVLANVVLICIDL